MDIDLSALTVTKAIAGYAVGAGVSKIAKDIIVNNTKAPEKAIDKITVFAGAAVLGMMAKKAAKEYTSEMIDDTVESVQKFRKELKERTADKNPVEGNLNDLGTAVEDLGEEIEVFTSEAIDNVKDHFDPSN